MLETIINALKVKEIRKKVIMMLLLLLVFRLGCFIPVPGLNSEVFQEQIADNSFLQLMNMITGSALSQGTLFALGIGPYINASIIMQLLAVGIPALERLSKQGEEGRKKIAQYTRYVTIVLAIIQSVGIIIGFGGFDKGNSEGAILVNLFFNQAWLAGVVMVIVYTAGAFLVMWLGERITDYGVGNGQSMIIFTGILSTAGQLILGKIGQMFGWNIGMASITGRVPTPSEAFWELVAFVLVSAVIFFAIVYVDLSERKVPIQYAKQIKGRKMYGGQSSAIPIKISGGGVMPLIFSFSILSFPQMICSMVDPHAEGWFTKFWNNYMSATTQSDVGIVVYTLVLCLLIFGFSFFYAQMQFDPEDVSRNIQQNGGFIHGIRPGKATENYLKKISNRITLFGAIYLSLVAFVPTVAFGWASRDLVNAFSTTGILIVVSVAIEFEKQLQAQMMMKTHKGFLK